MGTAALAPAGGPGDFMDSGNAGCALKPVNGEVANAVPGNTCGKILKQKTAQACGALPRAT